VSRAAGLSVWLLALLSAPVTAQAPEVDVPAVVDWAERMARVAQLPALAIVITDAEGTVAAVTVGESGGEAPLDPDSRFYIGSVTKTLTAVGLMRLVDRGAVELNAPLLRYMPELTFSDPERGAGLTVEHLLRHSSGLPTMVAFNRRVQQTGRIDHVRFFADPGQEVRYSSLNFQLLGMLIERVGGDPYAEFMEREVLAPAGMSRSTFGRTDEDLVQGHTYLFGFPVARDEPEYPELMVPTGYAITTPEDMAAYMRVYLNGGMGADGEVLSPEAVRAMATPPSGDFGVGLGWGVAGRWGSRALSHSGMTPGFYSTVALFPDEGIGITVMAARNAGPFLAAPDAVLEGLVLIVRGEEPEPYFPWERMIRYGLLVAILFDLWKTGRLWRAWSAMGRPPSVAHTRRVVGRLVLDLTLAVAIPLWIVLGLARLPIQGFLEFYPDFGIALIAFPALAIPAAVLRALTASRRWRQKAYAAGTEAAPAEG